MLGYLCLDIICSSKLTVFLELHKYPSIFWRQMKAIVYIFISEHRAARNSKNRSFFSLLSQIKKVLALFFHLVWHRLKPWNGESGGSLPPLFATRLDSPLFTSLNHPSEWLFNITNTSQLFTEMEVIAGEVNNHHFHGQWDFSYSLLTCLVSR